MFEWLSTYQVIFRITLQNGRRFIEETGEIQRFELSTLPLVKWQDNGASIFVLSAKQWNSFLKDLQGIRV